jgi:hypothetical protein
MDPWDGDSYDFKVENRRLTRPEGAKVTLRDMFTEDDSRSFEERRDEVISLLVQATDLDGHERYLRRAVHRCRRATDEGEFDLAYESLVTTISTAPLS